MYNPIFEETRRATCLRLNDLIPSILPQGMRKGKYWVALNPTRHDRSLGSFKINLETGAWADFATNDQGGDLISLASYLYGMPPLEAAKYVQRIAGVANDR